MYVALNSVLQMFQIWACKQVLGIANTNGMIHKWDHGTDPLCPSCMQTVKTTEHILFCNEAGRVKVLLDMVVLLDGWLWKMDTAPLLWKCIVQFCQGQGYVTMNTICTAMGTQYCRMARSQDIIGWRRFMEGMVSSKMIEIQRNYFGMKGAGWKLEKWASGLVV